MKRKPLLLVLLILAVAVGGCKKCYYCQNNCVQCNDLHFSIRVESQNYGATYYQMYIDSLMSLGWTCRDTNASRSMQVCAESDNTLNTDVNLAKTQGYSCTAVPN